MVNLMDLGFQTLQKWEQVFWMRITKMDYQSGQGEIHLS